MPMSCESVHSDSKDSATAPKLRRHGTRHHSQLQLPPKSLMNSDRGTTAAPCLLFSSQTRNNTPCWFCKNSGVTLLLFLFSSKLQQSSWGTLQIQIHSVCHPWLASPYYSLQDATRYLSLTCVCRSS